MTTSNVARSGGSGRPTGQTLFVLFLCLASPRSQVDGQIATSGNAVVKEWWLVALYRAAPFLFRDAESVPTPLVFLPLFERRVQQWLNLKVVKYEDTKSWSLHKLALYFFGVNALEAAAIGALAFAASIALVVVILPTLYFRLMLFADYETSHVRPNRYY